MKIRISEEGRRSINNSYITIFTRICFFFCSKLRKNNKFKYTLYRNISKGDVIV